MHSLRRVGSAAERPPNPAPYLLVAQPGGAGAGHCHRNEEHQEEPQPVQERADVRASRDRQDTVCQGARWSVPGAWLPGDPGQGCGRPSTWGPVFSRCLHRGVGRREEKTLLTSLSPAPVCAARFPTHVPPPPPSACSPETRTALRHGLCDHDGRRRGPHGAGRCDCHAQGLRLGQHQPARVSGPLPTPLRAGTAGPAPSGHWAVAAWKGP